MSVLVSKRKESRLEVLVFAEELHIMLIELMQRRFGIKDVEHLVRVQYAHGKLASEDMAYYLGVLNISKQNVQHIATLLTNNLRAANSIYPRSEKECEQRREYQNNAIVNCEQLIKELQHVVTVFNVDVNIYDRYIKAIDREIGLIKRWRQRDQRHTSPKRATSVSSTNFANVNNNGNANYNSASNTNNGVRPDSLNN